jgi:hypothetical protein
MEDPAAPFEVWSERLKTTTDRELTRLAGDYQRLAERPDAPRYTEEEFESRREAVVAECERRGLRALSEQCRRRPK